MILNLADFFNRCERGAAMGSRLSRRANPGFSFSGLATPSKPGWQKTGRSTMACHSNDPELARLAVPVDPGHGLADGQPDKRRADWRQN